MFITAVCVIFLIEVVIAGKEVDKEDRISGTLVRPQLSARTWERGYVTGHRLMQCQIDLSTPLLESVTSSRFRSEQEISLTKETGLTASPEFRKGLAITIKPLQRSIIVLRNTSNHFRPPATPSDLLRPLPNLGEKSNRKRKYCSHLFWNKKKNAWLNLFFKP